MASVIYDNAQRHYPGTVHPAVKDLDLEIGDGEFLVLVGPSGCGKSTSLRMLAGLEEVTSGRISIDDRDVTALSPKDRDIAMVFQNYALYPHMSVAANMAFALKLAKIGKEERDRRVREAARLLDLEYCLDRKPKALSGGQRQRVAMGRAIVRQPQVFCMDEPLSNLDAKLRVATRAQIAALQQRLGTTTVYVTHDQVEAMTMGDRVAVMKDGILQQVDTPLELYDRPANLFVAGFVGSPAMNLLPATATDGRAQIGEYTLPIDRAATSQVRDITVGVRPEAWRIIGEHDGGLPVQITMLEELGADAYLHGTTNVQGGSISIVVRVGTRRHLAAGETIHVTTDPQHVHIFDTATGTRLATSASPTSMATGRNPHQPPTQDPR
ncbi:ABC transporter ATP-binding protein [Parasphingorhabdus pacifica]